MRDKRGSKKAVGEDNGGGVARGEERTEHKLEQGDLFTASFLQDLFFESQTFARSFILFPFPSLQCAE